MDQRFFRIVNQLIQHNHAYYLVIDTTDWGKPAHCKFV